MEEILIKLLEFQTQIRILHWQTKSFARHKAYDFAYTELNELLDTFVEVYQGKYPRIQVADTPAIELNDLNDLELNNYISSFILVLAETIPKKLEKTDTDLLNIRDEILGLVHKLKYLLTLK